MISEHDISCCFADSSCSFQADGNGGIWRRTWSLTRWISASLGWHGVAMAMGAQEECEKQIGPERG